MFRVVPPPIIRSANNCIYSIWYLSVRYCYLPTALHVSGGTTTHNQERKQLYLKHLVFVTPLLLPADCSACFGWYHHPSSGAQTTVSTASGICHTVTATCWLLCMFRVVPPPIIRSANNCIYSIWYLSHRYCYLPLAAGSSNASPRYEGKTRGCHCSH